MERDQSLWQGLTGQFFAWTRRTHTCRHLFPFWMQLGDYCKEISSSNAVKKKIAWLLRYQYNIANHKTRLYLSPVYHARLIRQTWNLFFTISYNYALSLNLVYVCIQYCLFNDNSYPMILSYRKGCVWRKLLGLLTYIYDLTPCHHSFFYDMVGN